LKKELAETLLTKIMGWSDAEKAEERALLESFASYKYDEYQQFAPGRRFLESLALWLQQFETKAERDIAYSFVKDRLIFVSNAEINSLVGLAFPTFVRPKLIADTAEIHSALEAHRVKSIVKSKEYRAKLRKTLFLGLSDGARTDQFRRAHPQDISHEQVFHAYDMSSPKAKGFTEKLQKDLSTIFDAEVSEDEAKFEYVVLLDDFTASGTSYIREDMSGGGKIEKIIRELDSDKLLGSLVAQSGVSVLVVIYIAADQAIEHIEERLGQIPFSKGSIEFRVVHRLNNGAKLEESADDGILSLARQDRYFDSEADDEHSKVGGKSKRLGYAECMLPVVLAHNTPNNSIFLLWAEDVHRVRGLFPRVSRHRKFE